MCGRPQGQPSCELARGKAPWFARQVLRA